MSGRLTSRVTSALIARALSLLATFAMTLIIARVLGPASSGSFFLAFTTLALVATIGRFGTDNFVLKVSGHAGVDLHAATRRLLAILVVASVTASLLLAGTVLWLFPGLLGESVALTVVAAFSTVPFAMSVFAGAVLRGTGRVALGIIAELGSLPTMTAVALLVLDQLGAATFETSLIVFAGSAAATALWSLPIALRRSADHRARVPQATTPPVINPRSLISMMGTSVLFYLLTWAPAYVLGATATLESVAQYAVSVRLAAFVSLGATMQTSYLAPEFSLLYHRGALADLNELCRRSTNRVTALAALIALPLVVAPGPILSLFYGDDYAPAAVALATLAGAALVVTALGQVNQLMLLCDLEHHALALNIAMLSAWATIGVLSGLLWGLPGVALFAGSVSVAYAAVAAVLLRRARSINPVIGLRPRS